MESGERKDALTFWVPTMLDRGTAGPNCIIAFLPMADVNADKAPDQGLIADYLCGHLVLGHRHYQPTQLCVYCLLSCLLVCVALDFGNGKAHLTKYLITTSSQIT